MYGSIMFIKNMIGINMNTIKKLIILTLAFGTICTHAGDGWLYRAYAGVFGRQSKQQSNKQASWNKVASVAAGVTGFSLLTWLGWKKYSSSKTTEWTIVEMDDEQEIVKQQRLAQIDAALLEKAQQALKTAKQEHRWKASAVNATQRWIDELNIEIEVAAEGHYNLVQQKRAAYITELANNKIAELDVKSDYLVMDSDRSQLQTSWEKYYSDIISQGPPMNSEASEFMKRLLNDTELKTYQATKQTPLDNQKEQLKEQYQTLKGTSDKLAKDVKQARLEKFFGEESTKFVKKA